MTDIRVGGRYKFEYERDTKNLPWKCVCIESGWATLQRMSFDYKRNERMSTTSIKIGLDDHGLYEVKGYNMPKVYISNKGEYYGFSFEQNKDDVGSVEIFIEDDKIKDVVFNNFC